MPRALKWLLMIIMPMVLLLVTARACVAVIPSSHNSSSSKARPMNTGILELKLGEYGKDLIARTPLKVRQGSVGGLAFFEVSDIATQTEPVVRLLHHARVLEFPRARSVIMDEDVEQDWPIGDISIDIKMPPAPDDAGQLEAMKGYDAAVFALFQDIVRRVSAAGWKRYISLHEPRVAGIDTYVFDPDYQSARIQWNVSLSPDPNFELTLEAWRNLGSEPSWQWYIDDALIVLSYSRSPRAQGYDVYDKFRIEIFNDRSLLIGFDPKSNSDLDAGIEAYEASVPPALAKRHKAEETARAVNIPILSGYVDPPIGGIAIPAQ